MSTWIFNLEDRGAIIDDNIIRTKAIAIANQNNIGSFKASNGWLYKFKKRHLLSNKVLHGESYKNVPEDYTSFLDILNIKVKEYGTENVFNADETGLFFKLIPSKTICSNIRASHKLLKDRISILLCCNMSGTIKKIPLVIGKFANPRCLKNFDTKSLVDYTHSNRGWMTSFIFNQWLLKWDLYLQKH